jgi:hypothetical protein
MVMANASLVEVDTSIFRKAFAAYDDLTGARSCSTQAVPHTNLSRSDLVLWLAFTVQARPVAGPQWGTTPDDAF